MVCFGPDRQHAERDGVVAEHMVPESRDSGTSAASRCVGVDAVADSGRPHGRACPTSCSSTAPSQQRHARDAVLPVGGDAEAARQARRLASAPNAPAITGSSAAPLTPVTVGASGKVRQSSGWFGGAMVALAVVLPDQLPVAVLDDRALERDLRLAESGAARNTATCRRKAAKSGGVVGEADEDIAGDASRRRSASGRAPSDRRAWPCRGRTAACRRGRSSSCDRGRRAAPRCPWPPSRCASRDAGRNCGTRGCRRCGRAPRRSDSRRPAAVM